MNAEQTLKYAILNLAAIWECSQLPDNLTGEEVDHLWDEADDIYDAIYEMREGEVDTNIDAPYSRHYESKSVAVQAPNGQWVGFTHWYGGGKHGNPEEIDWIEYAYLLDCKEEEKLVKVQTFTKIKESE